ncbi:hypothetical protein Cflav_PD0992 [Pedosphaera parvula Ellin514]|uniref:Uncharacterized protein n=1 Tax=Pedosphaera parvula (strain Ellin514) TaxID=320771 RepID=B9XPC4_PEDPL|nr:hypothetical protein Cflav_PD0992 [Pedosphaera parvula Ellin514]
MSLRHAEGAEVLPALLAVVGDDGADELVFAVVVLYRMPKDISEMGKGTGMKGETSLMKAEMPASDLLYEASF